MSKKSKKIKEKPAKHLVENRKVFIDKRDISPALLFHLKTIVNCNNSRKILKDKTVKFQFTNALLKIAQLNNWQLVTEDTGLNYEKMKSTKSFSIRANDKYRIELEHIDNVVYIKNISNHYGDN